MSHHFTNNDWQDNITSDPDLVAGGLTMPFYAFVAHINALIHAMPDMLSDTTGEAWEIDPNFDFGQAARDAFAVASQQLAGRVVAALERQEA